MNFQPNPRRALDLGTTLGPQIHRILRERIVCNDIEPGARLFEAAIAAEYAVSRQPVREAVIKLSMEGLVEVRPQRGTFVRKIAVADVLGARFVREAIEADIVKALAAAPPPGLADALRRELDEQKAAAHDPQRFIALDERFHRTLAEAAGKTYARAIIEGIKSQMDRVRYLSVRRFPWKIWCASTRRSPMPSPPATCRPPRRRCACTCGKFSRTCRRSPQADRSSSNPPTPRPAATKTRVQQGRKTC